MHVRGKKGRQVPILLTPELVKAVDALVATRTEVGVEVKNIYVFAAPTRGSCKPLRGYQAITNVIKRTPDLVMPHLLRSTKLRKYAATVAQISSLTNIELEWLSNHLGHSVDVHKEYYRLQDSAIELAKVSRLLIAVDNGQGKSLLGKSLADIQVDGKSLL